MSEEPCGSIATAYGELSDPRVAGHCEHKLLDILIIAVCAVITGAESWVEVETLGKLKEEKLRTLSNEITAIPELLRVLEVSDCMVTIDAMGGQKNIT